MTLNGKTAEEVDGRQFPYGIDAIYFFYWTFHSGALIV